MDKPDRYDEEIHRFLQLLEALTRLENLTIRDVERRLNWGKGTLNRIFSGRIELKVRHLLMLAEAVGVTPEHFFLLAYARMPEGTTLAQRAVVGRRELAAAAPPPPASPSADVTAELKRMMKVVLQEMMAEQEEEEAPPSRVRKMPKRRRSAG